MIMEIRTKRNQMGNVGYHVGRGSMSVWFKRVSLGIAILGLVLAAPAAAQNGRGNGNGGSEAAGVAGAGVGEAGQPVVLRPTGPVSGQFIVVFQDDITNPRGLANALARQNGFSLRGVYTTALKGFSARMPDAVAERLSLDPDVAYVEQDAYVHADELVTGVDRIDADTNATAGIGLGGMVDVDVAVIDSGISPHADLNWSNARFYNCIGGCVAANAFDDNGHGSHVAGTIGALDDGVNFNISGTDYEVVGVAPGARLWGFKVLDSGGSGSASDIISAIDKVTQLGVIEVANMSLTGQGLVALLRTAVQNSVASGVVHVVAAGNAQVDIYGSDGVLNESASFSCLLLGRNCPDDIFPASYPEAMAVSAMADFDGTAGGDQRAAASRGLDHQHADAQPGDDPVAMGEMGGPWGRGHRILAHHRAAGVDKPLKELSVLRRIDHPQAASEDRDRPRPCAQCPPMCFAVDPDRAPGNDGQSALGEQAGKTPGLLASVRGATPRTDDGHGKTIGRLQVSTDPQRRRRVRDRVQECWVVAVAAHDQPGVAFGHTPALARGVGFVQGAPQGIRRTGAQPPDSGKLTGTCRDHGFI